MVQENWKFKENLMQNNNKTKAGMAEHQKSRFKAQNIW